jgi:hypothetical protein
MGRQRQSDVVMTVRGTEACPARKGQGERRVSFFWLLGGSVLRRDAAGVSCRDQEGFYLCHLRFQEWVRGKPRSVFGGATGGRDEGRNSK